MTKPVVTALLLAAAITLSIIHAACQPQQEPEQKTGPSNATDLQVSAECSKTEPGTRVARFTWKVAREPGKTQRVDITPFRDGFEKEGKYQTVAQLAAKDSSAEWKGGEPGVNYYWRVLALTGEGWVPSETGRYSAPICPVDTVREPPR